jgi:type I restriction enzyme S subunit
MGAVFESLKCADIPNFELLLPPIDEQRAISRVLGSLDDKIDLNRRMNRTLEELAAVLFRSWFVDFDPVVAKAAGRKPAQLRAEIAGFFPAHFQDSDSGPIPVGWKTSTVENAVQTIIDHRGKTPTKLGGVWSDGGFPAVSAKNVKAGRLVNKDSMGYISLELYRKWMKQPLEAGDILLTSEAPLGEMLYLPKQVEWCLSQRVFGLRANRSVCVPVYLYCWLCSPEGQAELEARASGTTVMGIRQSELREVPILLPPMPIQQHAESVLEPMFRQLWHNEQENSTLAALRDTLLPKLLSGEMRVKQAEKLAEAKL